MSPTPLSVQAAWGNLGLSLVLVTIAAALLVRAVRNAPSPWTFRTHRRLALDAMLVIAALVMASGNAWTVGVVPDGMYALVGLGGRVVLVVLAVTLLSLPPSE